MDTILPKKYNNPVVIGLGVALIVAVGVAIYYMYKSPEPTLQAVPIIAKDPAQIETHVGGPPPRQGASSKPTLVLVWAKWCGHSTHMKPEWDKVVQILNGSGAIDTKEIEANENAEELKRAQPNMPGFQGFPHIRFYPHGYAPNKPSIGYEGQRTEEEIVKFAYKALQQK